MKKHILILLGATLWSFGALGLERYEADEGGLFLEPALVYDQGSVDVSTDVTATSEEDTTGLGVGLRLGGHVWESVFLGVDGRYARTTYDSAALGDDGNADSYNGGVTLGLQTPLAGVRVWGTYVMTGAIDPEELNGTDVSFEDANGYRVGAGIYFRAVSINLEFQDVDYRKTNVEGFGPIDLGEVDGIDATQEQYMLSLSFPLAL